MNAKEKHVYLFSELDQAEAYAKDCLLYTSDAADE